MVLTRKYALALLRTGKANLLGCETENGITLIRIYNVRAKCFDKFASKQSEYEGLVKKYHLNSKV